jgi:hypothetical protein
MQSGHRGNSQAEGDAREYEPDEKFSCHSQPTILSKEMSARAMSRVAGLAGQGGHAQASAPFSYE